MAALHYPGTPGTTLYAGMATPSAGTLLTTLTLVNTSAAEQAAGFVSPMFGQPFKQGDIPAGEYPAFTLTDDTPVPATIHSVTSWPDGSMKWCGVLLRVPAAVAGSGSLTVNVRSGGTAPASSARALSDFAAADLSVELVGVTNLSGTWSATLSDAITNGTAVQIGNGPAGAIWRVLGDFKQGGSAHGQLVCWHYVAALQNASGGLLGVRYLGRVAQPWADVTTPTPTRRVMTAALKSGATTLRSLQGHDTTETVGDNIGLPHYASFFTAGTDGRWDFVQGGGSASADCTVRVVHDEVYFIASRLVPPYDTSVSPTSSTSADYYPMGRGRMLRNMGTTGEREDIGILPSWYVRHLLTGSAVDERAVRVNGLASGGWRQVARRSTTGQIVPVADPSPSYAGMGAVQPLWRGPASYVSGFVSPSGNTSLWFSEAEPSHRPDGAFYPYLVTGEPQYLDMLVEHANGIISATVTESRTMNTTLPITASTIRTTSAYGERDVIVNGVTYKGGGLLFITGLSRIPAWGSRDMARAAAMYPDTCPAATETGKYLREVIDACYTALNAYNAALGSEWASSGIYCFDNRNDAAAPWCNGYFSNAICHSASILGTSSAQTLRAFLAQYWQRMAVDRDMATVFSFDGNLYDENGTRVTTAEGVLTSQSASALTFSVATGRFTVGGTLPFAPTNGDVIAFSSAMDADKPFAEAVDFRRLHVVNASGNTGQLALTPGGSPIAVTADVVVGKYLARVQNFAPHNSTQGDTSASGYLANITSAIRHHAACGDSVPAAVAEVVAKLTAAGTSFTADPKNAIASTYPGA